MRPGERLRIFSWSMAVGRIALTLCPLLLLAACEAPQAQCRKENPTNEAAYERCWNGVLQRQNKMLDRLHGEEMHGRE